jgi:hypothetical protein
MIIFKQFKLQKKNRDQIFLIMQLKRKFSSLQIHSKKQNEKIIFIQYERKTNIEFKDKCNASLKQCI